MSRILLIFFALGCFFHDVLAQTSAAPSKENNAAKNLAPLTPPPRIDDPGVKPTVATEPTTPNTSDVTELPVITVRRQGSDTIEEYRKNGQIYMIRILSQEGPPKYYVDHIGDGRLERDPREGPISPVYFKLYEWK